ncbi:MAG: cbb3-type cytochrome c oxidase subunit 3 [Amylibacter sp.]|nr:cbb3-type cytochrome c oxidase subunit 3 [Amylibacter sp.]
MDTYSLMREIADSWGLLAMVTFFLIVILMLFRPGANKMHKDASQIPFHNDEQPLADRESKEQPLEK